MDVHNLQESYDQVAEEYVARIFHELEHKPLDRLLLQHFAAEVRALGQVADIGCGPGHVARHLSTLGVDVFGIDLSPRMVELAQNLTPAVPFRQGDMTALNLPENSLGGIVAFYSIIHVPREQVASTLQGFYRTLQPGGLLLLSFHEGQQTLHWEEWWGKQVSLDFIFFDRSEIEQHLKAAGFVLEESLVRSPYEGFEVSTQRVYILARKLPSL